MATASWVSLQLEGKHCWTAARLQGRRHAPTASCAYSFSLFCALVLDSPLTAIVESLPARRLAFDLGLHVLLLGLAAITDDGRAAFRILARRIHQEVVLGIDLVLVRNQLQHQRRSGFAILRELAGRKKQTRGAITQHVSVIDLLALEFGHRHRVHLRRCRLTILEQLASVLALGIGAAEELAKTTGLELHLAAALVAFQARPFVTLDAVLAFFDLVAGAVGVVAADMQLVRLIQQIGVHGRAADRTAALAQQHQRFGLALVIGSDFVTRNQVYRGLATLLRRQAVAGTAEEHPGGSRANHHRPAAGLAGNVGQGRLVGTHAVFTGLGNFQLLAEVTVELVKHGFPLALALGDVIQVFFHAGGKAVVHQVVETLGQALGDDIAHLFGVEAAVVQRDVATILNGGNDRRIGRRTTDTALFHFLDQTRFGVARWRLGEMLARIELEQPHGIALVHLRQHIIFAALALLRHDFGITVELENTALGTQLEVACNHRDTGGKVLRRRHLTGNELAPDQLIQTLGVTLHPRALRRAQINVEGANRLVRFLRAVLAGITVGLLRQVLVTDLVMDETAHHADSISRQVGRVGTHVGDVAGFVKTLGHHHGLLHAEAEAIARRLLQGRSDEGRRRLAAGRLVFTLADAVAGTLQLLQRGHGLALVERLERLAVFTCNFEA